MRKTFFRRVKAGENPGYPRFRGPDRYDSFCFPQSGFSITHDNRVTLSKIGRIKMVYHRPMKGRLKTCSIHKSSTGKWYVCFSVECEPERLPECASQVGIDVGLTSFATLSNAQEIANPRFFRKEEKTLATVQRKHATLAKSTPQRKKKTKQTITRAGTHIRLIEALKARCLSAGIGSRCEPPAEIAKSWRTNRHHAYEAYREDLADYAQAKADASDAPLTPNEENQSGANGSGLRCVFPQSRPMWWWLRNRRTRQSIIGCASVP